MKTRFEKAEEIIKNYTREARQCDLAKKFGMSVEDIGKVLRLFGFSHTKKVTEENRNNGQYIKAFVHENELSFLDKYDF